MFLKMKVIFTALVCATALTTINAQAQVSDPLLVEVGLSTAYIPKGFDSNDRIQIMVESYLPNTCYKLGPHKVTVDEEARRVKIQQAAYRYNGMCLMMIVPYYHLVDVGILKAGEYEVIDSSSKRVLGQIPVRQATSSNADDNLYAPVSDAQVVKTEEGRQLLKFSGAFTDSCVELSRVEVIKESKNVVTVLPIAIVKEGVTCHAGEYPFRYEQELVGFEKGRYMLHVRSMNGNAVARLFDITE